MNVRERFEKVRAEQKNRFSLRTRLTLLVTLEIQICILVSYGLDALLGDIIKLPFEVPLELELVFVSLLIGIFVTNQLSKYFFDPIKKLLGAMDKVAYDADPSSVVQHSVCRIRHSDWDLHGNGAVVCGHGTHL